ncbi:MAG: type II secretion system F family protein [Gammaproteobacteria bacterium]|nr:type II secretion system F family protein [Gammaproteobacteria bacterium]
MKHPSLVRKLVNLYRVQSRFPRADRVMFYRVIEYQIRAGASMKTIFQLLRDDLKITPEITRIAGQVSQALAEGRPAAEGMLESNFFPPEDIGLLLVAERRDAMPTVLDQLATRTRDNLTFFGEVIRPNLYYGVILAVLLFLASKITDYEDLLGSFTDLSTNPAWELSVLVNAYGPVAGAGLLVLILVIWYGKAHWYGGHRKFLPFFDRDARLQYGIRFCGLSRVMSHLGASYDDTLTASLRAFGGSRFMTRGLSEMQRLYSRGGMPFDRALSLTILDGRMAAALGALALGGDRQTQARAFAMLEQMQTEICRKRYAQGRTITQILLLSAVAYTLLSMVLGMYEIYNI